MNSLKQPLPNNIIILLIFCPLFGIFSSFSDFGTHTFTHIVKNFMAKTSKPEYLTAKNQINKVSEADLKKALNEVEKRNAAIRKSFKSDSDSMSLRAGR